MHPKSHLMKIFHMMIVFWFLENRRPAWLCDRDIDFDCLSTFLIDSIIMMTSGHESLFFGTLCMHFFFPKKMTIIIAAFWFLILIYFKLLDWNSLKDDNLIIFENIQYNFYNMIITVILLYSDVKFMLLNQINKINILPQS